MMRRLVVAMFAIALVGAPARPAMVSGPSGQVKAAVVSYALFLARRDMDCLLAVGRFYRTSVFDAKSDTDPVIKLAYTQASDTCARAHARMVAAYPPVLQRYRIFHRLRDDFIGKGYWMLRRDWYAVHNDWGHDDQATAQANRYLDDETQIENKVECVWRLPSLTPKEFLLSHQSTTADCTDQSKLPIA